MSMVRIRAENGDVFDIESTWLPLLHRKQQMQLPIRTKEAMDDLVHYVRQRDKILRLPRRPTRDEEGRIVRRRIDIAALDAQATGVIASRGITAEDQMDEFKRAFVSNRDLTSLVHIYEAATDLGMWELAKACLDRMLNEGVLSVQKGEEGHELLGDVQ